jgi:hypothetical protein
MGKIMYYVVRTALLLMALILSAILSSLLGFESINLLITIPIFILTYWLGLTLYEHIMIKYFPEEIRRMEHEDKLKEIKHEKKRQKTDEFVDSTNKMFKK